MTAGQKVLVVEDEEGILEVLSYSLRSKGYRILPAVTAEAGRRLFEEERPDIAILDVMLPGRSGFDLCRTIRSCSETPVLFLTARASESDKAQAFEAGADDYVTKPFSVREVEMRVSAILRRHTEAPPLPRIVTAGDLWLDEGKHEARVGGRPLTLTRVEFRLLAFLAINADMPFDRSTLLDRVWESAEGNSRTVDVHIRWLRQKIEEDPSTPKRLVTVHGLGYMFVPQGG